MANTLIKVSNITSIDPSIVGGSDLLYFIHQAPGKSVTSTLKFSDIFVGSNYISTNMRFNADTLYIKHGKIGINKEPSQPLDVGGNGIISGSLTVTGNTALTNPVTMNSTLVVTSTIRGGSIQNTPIGSTTHSTGKFTTLLATGNTNIQGQLTATSGIASSSTSTGAIVVTGGVGISGNIYSAGNLNITGTITSDSSIYAVGNITTTAGNINASGGTLTIDTIHSSKVIKKDSFLEIINVIYPIGCIYMTAISQNPGTTFGIGTWAAWGEGKVPVSYLVGDADFGTVEAVGGEKTHTLTIPEMPAHSNHRTQQNFNSDGFDVQGAVTVVGNRLTHSHVVESYGGGLAHNNLQPFIVCYMWKRTA
jgi:hypothetical protein